MSGPKDSPAIDALVDEIVADVPRMQRLMLETWTQSEAYASRAARVEWFATWRQVLTTLEGRTTGADPSTIALAQATLTWFEAHVPELLGEAQRDMDVDHIPAGRELDSLVARHVFGLAVEERTNTRTRERDYVYPAADGGVLRVPAYSRDFTASLSVEAWLEERGWQRIAPMPGESGVVVCRHTDGRTIEVRGLLEEAIARTSLQVATLAGLGGK